MQRAGFALPVIDSDRLTVRYDNPLALMRDLRAMGATEHTNRTAAHALLKRATYAADARKFTPERFADADGRLRATFEIVRLYRVGAA